MSFSVWSEFLRDEGYTGIVPVASDTMEATPEDTWEQRTAWWEAQIMEYLYVGPQVARQFEIMERYRYHEDGTITRERRSQPIAGGE